MDNPYSPPATSPVHHGHDSTTGITPGVLQALAATKPWVRLCSVIGFIGTGLMLLAGAGMLVAGAIGAFSTSDAAMPLAGFPIVLSLVYFVMAALYIVPSLKLWTYGSHILNLMSSQSMLDLEAALNAQRSFWKFVGIMILVMIGIYALVFIGALIFGIAGAAALSP